MGEGVPQGSSSSPRGRDLPDRCSMAFEEAFFQIDPRADLVFLQRKSNGNLALSDFMKQNTLLIFIFILPGKGATRFLRFCHCRLTWRSSYSLSSKKYLGSPFHLSPLLSKRAPPHVQHNRCHPNARQAELAKPFPLASQLTLARFLQFSQGCLSRNPPGSPFYRAQRAVCSEHETISSDVSGFFPPHIFC